MAMFSNGKGLAPKSLNIEPQKSAFTPRDDSYVQKEGFTFMCKDHYKKPIVFICTAKNCENNLLCAECVLESPSLLIRYKDNVYTIQDYIESSKSKLLQVKVEKEFHTLKKKVNETLEIMKEDIKNAVSSPTAYHREDSAYRKLDKKLGELAIMSSASKEKDIFNKENLDDFIKETNKYEDIQKGYCDLNSYREGDNQLEFKYFEFLIKIKLQIDGFCKNIQKQTANFIEKLKEPERSSQGRDHEETAQPHEEANYYSNGVINNGKKGEVPFYNQIPNLNVLNMSLGEDEETFNFEQEATEHFDYHKVLQNQPLKGLAPSFSKDPIDEVISTPEVMKIKKLEKNMPKDGLKILTEFPTTYNSIVREAISKHGVFRFEMHETSINSGDKVDENSTPTQDALFNKKRLKYGPILMENGDVYEGEWNEDKRDGYGKLLSATGFLYEGFWKDNMAHGKGRLINVNGDMYEGDWGNGKYHGRGTFVGANGYHYVGEWSHDMQHGYGNEYWPDGSSYEGEYKWSKKHGKGVFKWANEEKYIGEFCLNNMHGNGIYEWPNGQRYYGYWVENKISGEGRLEKPKNTGKIKESEAKIFLSPDCSLYKHDIGAQKPEENMKMDHKSQYDNFS